MIDDPGGNLRRALLELLDLLPGNPDLLVQREAVPDAFVHVASDDVRDAPVDGQAVSEQGRADQGEVRGRRQAHRRLDPVSAPQHLRDQDSRRAQHQEEGEALHKPADLENGREQADRQE